MNEKKKTSRVKTAVSALAATVLVGGAILGGAYIHDSQQVMDTSASVSDITAKLAQVAPVSEFGGQAGLDAVQPVSEFGGQAGLAPVDSDPSALPTPGDAQTGEAYALIESPVFGTQPVVMGSRDGDTNVNDALLDEGVVSYGRLATPGEVGNFAVSAHRTLDGILSTPNGIFIDVPELREGDVVTVRTVEGSYDYKVIKESFKVLPDAKGILDSDPLSDEVNEDRKLMTIQTCGVGGAEVEGEWKSNGLDYREIIVLELVEG